MVGNSECNWLYRVARLLGLFYLNRIFYYLFAFMITSPFSVLNLVIFCWVVLTCRVVWCVEVWVACICPKRCILLCDRKNEIILNFYIVNRPKIEKQGEIIVSRGIWCYGSCLNLTSVLFDFVFRACVVELKKMCWEWEHWVFWQVGPAPRTTQVFA